MYYFHRRISPKGFTLVELLVVISIIAALVGLLLPALASVRESMRRTQCLNNTRSLAQALNTYEQGHKTFPPGVPSCVADPTEGSPVKNLGVSAGAVCQGPNWLSAILVHLDDQPQYNQLMTCLNNTWNACDECSRAGSAGTDTWLATGPIIQPYMKCPSAPDVFTTLDSSSAGLKNIAKGNYAGCYGSEVYRSFLTNKQGVFQHVVVANPPTNTPSDPAFKSRGKKLGHNKGTPMAIIKDGASKTIMLSEVLAVDSATDGRGLWTVGAMGCSGFTAMGTPNNTTIPDQIPMCDTTLLAASPLKCTQNNTTKAFASARSSHTGGVCAATADARTIFISDTIQADVWQANCTIAGNEPVQITE